MIGSEVELKWNRKDLESLRLIVDRFVPRRRQVVQAGGCYGVFAGHLADVGFGAVYVFEPDLFLFRAMMQNIGARENVVLLHAALGFDRRLVRTECSLRPNDGKTVLHEGMTRTEPGGIVPTLQVDDLGLTECDLIYLDVEGDEMFALAGARETILRCKPVVVCEINRGITYRGFEEADVYARMRLYGYGQAARFRSDVVFTPANQSVAVP